MKAHMHFGLFFAGIVAMLIAGCQTAPKTEEKRTALVDAADDALKQMAAVDPGVKTFVDKSYGHVMFPKVGKGGFIAGGSYGRGVVYEGSNMIGYSDISQASVGLQAGGQTFMQLMCFERKEDLDRFTGGRLTMTANASAVILKTGAADSAKYTDGVAVFVKPIGGAMAEASIGGQQFTYQPK